MYSASWLSTAIIHVSLLNRAVYMSSSNHENRSQEVFISHCSSLHVTTYVYFLLSALLQSESLPSQMGPKPNPRNVSLAAALMARSNPFFPRSILAWNIIPHNILLPKWRGLISRVHFGLPEEHCHARNILCQPAPPLLGCWG